MPTLAPTVLDTGADRRARRAWEHHPILVAVGAAVVGFVLVLALVVALGGSGRDAAPRATVVDADAS